MVHKKVVFLNITDDYAFIDADLCELLGAIVSEYIWLFYMRYVDSLLEDKDGRTIDLYVLEAELRTVKGIGEKRLDIIMSIIEKCLGV